MAGYYLNRYAAQCDGLVLGSPLPRMARVFVECRCIGLTIATLKSLSRGILAVVICCACPWACTPAPPIGPNGNDNTTDNTNDNSPGEEPLDVANIQSATWLLVVNSDIRAFTATAFGVDTDLFVTAAAMTESIKLVFREPHPAAFLYQHNTGAVRIVRRVWTHPDFVSDAPLLTTPGVGLLETEAVGEDEREFVALVVAGNEDLQGLTALEEVSLCGFSSNIIDADNIVDTVNAGQRLHPQSTCLQGVISVMGPFDASDLATPENSFLIQHDVAALGGFTGAPLFDANGRVVGVHLLTFGDALNFALRADKLTELIQLVESGQLEGTLLEAVDDCVTSYDDAARGYGFDLPDGFTGPVTASGSFLYGADFVLEEGGLVVADMRARIFEPSGSLQDFVSAYVAALTNAGSEVLSESFTTSNGREAQSLSYLTSGNAGSVSTVAESWVEGSLGFYNLRGITDADDPAGVAAELRAATLTLCTDVVE